MSEKIYNLRRALVNGKSVSFKDGKVQVKGNEWRVQLEGIYKSDIKLSDMIKDNVCLSFSGEDLEWTIISGTCVLVEASAGFEEGDKALFVGVGKLKFKHFAKKRYSERLTTIEESLDELRHITSLKPLFFSEIEWLIQRAKKCEELERNGEA
jgi:hypothetical protein